MGADMLIAAIAVRSDRTVPLTFDHGRRAVDAVTDADAFEFDDPESDLEALIDRFDPDTDLDADGSPTIGAARRAGQRIVDELEEALDGDEVASIVAAGYRIYLSGGMSWGDRPTDAADTIWNAHKLPEPVLVSIGFVPDYSKPLSPVNAGAGAVTDTDVVNAIALGLGTRPEWSGADELEWIADAIGQVREHPGDQDPAAYRRAFAAATGLEPTQDEFLAGYVDADAWPEDSDGEDES